MPKNGCFHSHKKNFDVENEAHKKIDHYPHTDHPVKKAKSLKYYYDN